MHIRFIHARVRARARARARSDTVEGHRQMRVLRYTNGGV